MPRGPKKHMKRIVAPKKWMLDKLGGIYAPRPSAGPHKLRECLPLILILRNRLKFALNGRETTKILKQRVVKVDNKVRTDNTYPAGFMDIVSIDKVNANYRILYNAKGKFHLVRVKPDEAKYKLVKVRKVQLGPRGVPFAGTHDGRTLRYPHPNVKVGDTLKLNLETGKIEEHVKFGLGNLVMVTAGRNTGRVGVLKSVEKHQGTHHMVHVEDMAKKVFATRLENIFVIGQGKKSMVSLPRGGGVKLSPLEEKAQRLNKARKNA